jgi:hypothetical protein
MHTRGSGSSVLESVRRNEDCFPDLHPPRRLRLGPMTGCVVPSLGNCSSCRARSNPLKRRSEHPRRGLGAGFMRIRTGRRVTFPRFRGHRLSGLAFCLIGSDIADGRMEPLAIVAFDVGE